MCTYTCIYKWEFSWKHLWVCYVERWKRTLLEPQSKRTGKATSKSDQTPVPMSCHGWNTARHSGGVCRRHRERAIRYNGSFQPWTVWWAGSDTSTEEPFSQLFDVDRAEISKAMFKKGKRHDLAMPAEPPMAAGHPPIVVQYQCMGAFRALNSVANAVSLPPELYRSIRSEGSLLQLRELQDILKSAVRSPCRLRRVRGIPKARLLGWLRQQREGLFVLQFVRTTSGGGWYIHCITWDATRQVVMETDPSYPYALGITEDTLATLGLSVVELVYRVVEAGAGKTARGKRKKKDRKAEFDEDDNMDAVSDADALRWYMCHVPKHMRLSAY